MPEVWRKCSSCKNDIHTGKAYYVCSVSTCNTKVTNYVFCSISCWDAHVPTERHREGSAGALERKAPAPGADVDEGRRRVLVSSPASSSAPSAGAGKASEDDVLVVVTKVRKYIADRSGGMNTSASVYEALSEKIRRLCDMAIDTARSQGRKTVMDRDVP